MLDIVQLRKDLDAVIARLETRKQPQAFLNVEAFRALEAERKTLQTRTEELQSQRNSLSKQIGMLKGKGQHAEADAVMAEVGQYKTELEHSAARLDQIQGELLALTLVSNPGHASHAGELSLEQEAAIIRRAQGSHGTNRDYLEQLVEQLDRLGMVDGYVQQLSRLVADSQPVQPVR